MYDYWKQFAQGLSLERFMAAVENSSQPLGPPDATQAIKLAHDQLLKRQVPLADVAAATWELVTNFRTGSTHDLALVAGLYFLQKRAVPEPLLDAVRLEARLLAQEWMTLGHASLSVVSRFEAMLYDQFP